MHHSDFTVQSKKHSMAHPVPILNHAAHRRRKKSIRLNVSEAYGLIVTTKRKRFCIRPTVLNVFLLMILLAIPGYFLAGWLIRSVVKLIILIGGGSM